VSNGVRFKARARFAATKNVSSMLPPRSRVHIKKLTVTQLVKKRPTLYGNMLIRAPNPEALCNIS